MDYKNYYKHGMNTFDIAEVLLDTAGSFEEEEKDELISLLEQAVYDVQQIAKNKYNHDYWRVLFNVLDKITEKKYY